MLLLIAYPTKALTNPLFYVKLALIAIGLGMWSKLRARVALPVPEAPVLPPRLKAAGGGLAGLLGGGHPPGGCSPTPTRGSPRSNQVAH